MLFSSFSSISVRFSLKCVAYQVSKNYFPIIKPYVKEIGNVRRSVHNFKFPLDDITRLSKDTVLYSYENAKFYKYLGFFGVVQLCAWANIGFLIYDNLIDIRTIPEENSGQYLKNSLLGRINLGDKKYRIISLLACLSVGIGTLVITFALPSRIVRHLVLHKGGTTATITTYNPFGRMRDINVNLRQLSCQYTRQEAKSYLSLKVKGRRFHFLIDCKGNFYNPQLFDYTVGAARARVW